MYDVGCGDGRVLIQMASKSSIPSDSPTPPHPSRDDTINHAHDRNCNGSNRQQQQHQCRRFVGIEISSSRADEARSNIDTARSDGLIPSHVSIEIRCGNALEVDYRDATVIFLYLVPRGLRLIRAVLDPSKDNDNGSDSGGGGGGPLDNTDSRTVLQRPKKQKPRRIISYMNPMEGWPVARKEYCKVGNVEGAAFPIFLYHL